MNTVNIGHLAPVLALDSMIRYLLLFSMVLVVSTNTQAQQLQFRRIPSSYERMRTGYWVSLNGKPLLYDPENRAFQERSDVTGQWAEVDRFPFPYQLAEILHTKNDGAYVWLTYYTSTSLGDSITQYKPDGSKHPVRKLTMPFWGNTDQYEYAQGGLYACGFNSNPTGPNSSLVYILVAKYMNGAWSAMDSIPTKYPQDFKLFRDPLESNLYITITEYAGKSTKQTTYRSTNSSAWMKLDTAISYVGDGVQLGSSFFVAYESKLCKTDSTYSFFSPVDSILAVGVCKVNDSTMVSWFNKDDKAGSRIYYTTDGGSTFRRNPASTKLAPGRDICTLVGSTEGAVYITTDSDAKEVRHHFCLRDTIVTLVTSPTIETTREHPVIVPVRQAPGMFFALPALLTTTYDSCLFDINTNTWRSLPNGYGKPLLINQAFTGTHHTIVMSDSGMYVLLGPELRAVRVDSSVVGAVEAIVSCNFISNTTALVLTRESLYEVADRWYRVDVETGKASAIETDWSDGTKPCKRSSQASCVVDTITRTLVAGVSGQWSTTGDSSVQVCDRYGVLVSTDSGATWRNYNEGFESTNYCWDVKSHGGSLYALMSYSGYGGFRTRELMFRRDPDGPWKPAAPLPIELTRPMRMTVQPSGAIYICRAPIVRTLDRGETFELLSTNLPENTIFSDVMEVGKHVLASTVRYVWIAENPRTSIEEQPNTSQPLARWDGSSFIVGHANEPTTATMTSYAWDMRGNRIPLLEVSAGIYKPLYDLSRGLYMLQIGDRYYRGMVY